MNFKQIFENFIAYMSRRYVLDFENVSLSFLILIVKPFCFSERVVVSKSERSEN